jgi:TolA-binding protein
MRFLFHHLIALLALVLGAQAQATKPATPPPASVVSAPAMTEDTFYPLPPERKGQIRDLQYQVDQAQIKIEQLRQQQVAWNDSIASIATDYARIKNLNVVDWDLDPVNLRLQRKTPPAPPVLPKK